METARTGSTRELWSAFPAAVWDNRRPDYAPTFGALPKAIQGIGKRLPIVEDRIKDFAKSRVSFGTGMKRKGRHCGLTFGV